MYKQDTGGSEKKSRGNIRHKNGNFRRKMREKFKAMDAPCGICKGKLGPIRYDQKSCSTNPLSFVIDERLPVSRWREFGYDSAQAACMDIGNLQAAHWCCNAAKSNKTMTEVGRRMQRIHYNANASDGNW